MIFKIKRDIWRAMSDENRTRILSRHTIRVDLTETVLEGKNVVEKVVMTLTGDDL